MHAGYNYLFLTARITSLSIVLMCLMFPFTLLFLSRLCSFFVVVVADCYHILAEFLQRSKATLCRLSIVDNTDELDRIIMCMQSKKKLTRVRNNLLFVICWIVTASIIYFMMLCIFVL